jgi:hypothetical protein
MRPEGRLTCHRRGKIVQSVSFNLGPRPISFELEENWCLARNSILDEADFSPARPDMEMVNDLVLGHSADPRGFKDGQAVGECLSFSFCRECDHRTLAAICSNRKHMPRLNPKSRRDHLNVESCHDRCMAWNGQHCTTGIYFALCRHRGAERRG